MRTLLIGLIGSVLCAASAQAMASRSTDKPEVQALAPAVQAAGTNTTTSVETNKSDAAEHDHWWHRRRARNKQL